MVETFNQWYSRVKFKKTAYFAMELKPLLQKCWEDAKPKKKMTRSQKQNRYMWGVVYKIMADEIGYLPDECHQLMQKQFLKYQSKGGEWFVKSTTKLDTKDMELYLENVRRFNATELNCYIPLPNETDFSYEVKK